MVFIDAKDRWHSTIQPGIQNTANTVNELSLIQDLQLTTEMLRANLMNYFTEGHKHEKHGVG